MMGNKAICKTKKDIELSCRVEVGLLEERVVVDEGCFHHAKLR